MKARMHRISLTAIFVCAALLAACAGTPAASNSGQPSPAAAEQTAPPPEPTPTTAPIACSIAFESSRDANTEIYVMNADGSNQVNVSNHPAHDTQPSWSPDGKQIAFVSDREEGQHIFVMDADGSNVRMLQTPGNSDLPEWSGNGLYITLQNENDIYLIKADGSAPYTNLTKSPQKDSNPSFSPDSQHIAWISDGNIFTMKSDGSDVQQVTQEGTLTNVVWTTDGRLVTVSWDSREHGKGNYVMNADGSEITPAGGKGELFRFIPFWTKDGKVVECASIDLNKSGFDIYLISESYPDAFLNISNSEGDALNPDWPLGCVLGRDIPAAATPTPAPTATATPEATPTARPLTIGYAGETAETEFNKQSFLKACTDLGVECVFDELEALIKQGVNAVVVNTSAQAAPSLAGELKSAVEQGIKVIVLGAEVEVEGVYSVISNPEDWVRIPLHWLAEKMGGEGEMILYNPNPDAHKEFVGNALGAYPNIKVVVDIQEKLGSFDDVKGKVYEWLEEFPNVKAIWAGEDMSTVVLGVADKTQGAKGWVFTNCEASEDGLYIWIDRLKEHPQMECIAVSETPALGYVAANAAFALCTGWNVKESALGGKLGHALVVDLPIVENMNVYQWLEWAQQDDDPHTPLAGYPTVEEIRARWFSR